MGEKVFKHLSLWGQFSLKSPWGNIEENNNMVQVILKGYMGKAQGL